MFDFRQLNFTSANFSSIVPGLKFSCLWWVWALAVVCSHAHHVHNYIVHSDTEYNSCDVTDVTAAVTAIVFGFRVHFVNYPADHALLSANTNATL